MEQQTYREQFELEDGHWWFKGRRAVIWALLRSAVNGSRLRVLDAGCGTGRNLVEFGKLGTVQGVDASPDAIEYCRRRGIEDAVLGSLEHLPFADASFDLVLATDVLEHIDDDHAALSELRRVTAAGGHLLATVPAYRWLWSEHDDAHHHVRRYTLRRLRERVQLAGWQPLQWSYFNSALLAPIAAVRLASRVRPADASGPLQSDVRPTGPAVNRLLQRPMRLEAALIGRGMRLPAGVSIGILCGASEDSRGGP